MFIFFGGGSVTKRVYFDTHEEAKTEFEEIQKNLNNFIRNHKIVQVFLLDCSNFLFCNILFSIFSSFILS